MARIHLQRKHNLARTEARARVEAIASKLSTTLNAKYAWEGDALRFTRSGASGSINIGDDLIEVEVRLGLLLTPMKGAIENAIRDNVDAALSDKASSASA